MSVGEWKEYLEGANTILAREKEATIKLEALIGDKTKKVEKHEQRCALESKAEEASDTDEGDYKKADAKAKPTNEHGEAEKNTEG